jgi:hypothetical protein
MAQVQVMDVIADVAQIVRQAPNATLIGAYIRAARKFCRESRWYRATLAGATEAGTRVYSLGSDPYLEVLGLRAASAAVATGDPWPLGVSNTTSWGADNTQSKPRRYAYVPEAQVALDPIPDAIYTLSLTLVLQPKSGVTSVPEELLVKWDQALQDGALGYLLDIAGMPWTDPMQAERHRRAFQAAISNARADEQREFNAGSQFIRRRAFIVGARP